MSTFIQQCRHYSAAPWEWNSNFPWAVSIDTPSLQLVRIVALSWRTKRWKLQIWAAALCPTARLIFHPLPVSTFGSRQKCGWIITVTKMCKGVKSPLTHFISSTDNGHPGMTKNTVLHETDLGMEGGGREVGDDETAEKHTFLSTTWPAICVKFCFFLLNMLTGLSSAPGRRQTSLFICSSGGESLCVDWCD